MPHSTHNTEDLYDFARILGQQTEFHEILRLVAHQSAQTFKADLSLILMLNPDSRETVKTIIQDGKYIEQKVYQDIHIYVGGWIINHQTHFLSRNLQKDDRFIKGLFDQVPIKSVAGVPLVIEGMIIGALILLYRKSSDILKSDLLHSLDHIAAVSVPFLRNAQKIRDYFVSSLPDSSLVAKYNTIGLYGKSSRFIEMLHAIEAATEVDTRVLLIGKTGTGKELIAKAIHNFSARADFPFIATNCGAIPNTLLESEFFGHTKGAFTGAHTERQGLFLKANNGTLFLDEINNLPLDMQSKFLRVIEDGQIRPIGSDDVAETNVRIITASSTPLKELVEAKLFREDLFYRIHVYPIYVPDLSKRQEDIPLLAIHFLHYHARQQKKKAKHFHEEVIDYIKQRTWQGNVRELENFIERIVTVTPPTDEIISSSRFPGELKKEIEKYRLEKKSSAQSMPLKAQLDHFETEIIKSALTESDWNRSKAARKLNISEGDIRYKIDKLNISKPDAE